MSGFQSSIIYGFILAGLGFVVLSVVGEVELAQNVIFASGLLIGSLVTGFLSHSGQAVKSVDENSTTAPSGPTKTIYVGNLPYRANEASVKELFEKHGQVHSVRLLKDRQTGKRRGFGFVEMDANGGDKGHQCIE